MPKNYLMHYLSEETHSFLLKLDHEPSDKEMKEFNSSLNQKLMDKSFSWYKEMELLEEMDKASTPKEAISNAKKVLKLNPSNIFALMELCNEEKDLDKRLARLNKLGDDYLASIQKEKGVDLAKFKGHYHDNPFCEPYLEIEFKIVHIYNQKQDYKESLKIYDLLLTLDKDDHLGARDYKLSLLLFTHQNEEIKKMLSLYPKDSGLVFFIARWYLAYHEPKRDLDVLAAEIRARNIYFGFCIAHSLPVDDKSMEELESQQYFAFGSLREVISSIIVFGEFDFGETAFILEDLKDLAPYFGLKGNVLEIDILVLIYLFGEGEDGTNRGLRKADFLSISNGTSKDPSHQGLPFFGGKWFKPGKDFNESIDFLFNHFMIDKDAKNYYHLSVEGSIVLAAFMAKAKNDEKDDPSCKS